VCKWIVCCFSFQDGSGWDANTVTLDRCSCRTFITQNSGDGQKREQSRNVETSYDIITNIKICITTQSFWKPKIRDSMDDTLAYWPNADCLHKLPSQRPLKGRWNGYLIIFYSAVTIIMLIYMRLIVPYFKTSSHCVCTSDTPQRILIKFVVEDKNSLFWFGFSHSLYTHFFFFGGAKVLF